jgi:hypothetical protein
MSTIRVRKLDASWDPVFGGGINDYLTDRDAVGQIIRSRLLFFQSEWWEDESLGLPMFQSILGKKGPVKKVADKIISDNILQAPYVVRIDSFDSTLVNRVYTFTAYVTTQFGNLTITNNNGGT